MGSDVVIAGDLRFPKGAVAKWRSASAALAKAKWPSMIGAAVINLEEEPGTVADVLAFAEDYEQSNPGAPALLTIAMDGDVVRVRAMLGEDDYGEVGGKIVGLVSAAARAGASGRVQFRDAGARTGAAVLVEDGTLRFTKHGPIEAPDQESFQDVFERLRQKLPPLPPPTAASMAVTMRRLEREKKRKAAILAKRAGKRTAKEGAKASKKTTKKSGKPAKTAKKAKKR
jgi:hypothetical protein